MDIQRIRNLTTGILHTQMQDIYADVKFLTNAEGVMTHMLPNFIDALEPYLKSKLKNARFWDNKFDPSHTGSINIQPMNTTEQKEFWNRYKALPNPLKGKNAVTDLTLSTTAPTVAQTTNETEYVVILT